MNPDYRFAAIILVIAYGVFRTVSWVISTAIKMMFVVAFVALAVLVMSSSVGLV